MDNRLELHRVRCYRTSTESYRMAIDDDEYHLLDFDEAAGISEAVEIANRVAGIIVQEVVSRDYAREVAGESQSQNYRLLQKVDELEGQVFTLKSQLDHMRQKDEPEEVKQLFRLPNTDYSKEVITYLREHIQDGKRLRVRGRGPTKSGKFYHGYVPIADSTILGIYVEPKPVS